MLSFIGLLLASIVTWGVNPVYSILTLITSSLCLGMLLLFSGLEFIPFLVILIYIGAVAVLFLFVVMMINFKASAQLFNLSEGIIFWFIISLSLFSILDYNVVSSQPYHWWTKSNFYSLASYIYTTQASFFISLVGLTLFIAMVGAISLTYVTGENYRSQHIPTQTSKFASVYTFETGPVSYLKPSF